jgi:hypothetical protein
MGQRLGTPISGNLINCTGVPADIAAAIAALIPSGTLMLFQQTAAPTGWTKQTTHNDKALRVVSGAASSGGTNAFSTVMAQTTVGSTTLTTSQIPAHSHAYNTQYHLGSAGAVSTNGTAISGNATSFGLSNYSAMPAQSTSTDGGTGGSHNHTITLSVQYVDLIIASKD